MNPRILAAFALTTCAVFAEPADAFTYLDNGTLRIGVDHPQRRAR